MHHPLQCSSCCKRMVLEAWSTILPLLGRNYAVEAASERGVHAASPSDSPGASVNIWTHYSVSPLKRRERRAPPAFADSLCGSAGLATAPFRLGRAGVRGNCTLELRVVVLTRACCPNPGVRSSPTAATSEPALLLEFHQVIPIDHAAFPSVVDLGNTPLQHHQFCAKEHSLPPHPNVWLSSVRGWESSPVFEVL